MKTSRALLLLRDEMSKIRQELEELFLLRDEMSRVRQELEELFLLRDEMSKICQELEDRPGPKILSRAIRFICKLLR